MNKELHQDNLHLYAFIDRSLTSLNLPYGIASQVLLISSDNLSALVEPGVSLESFQKDDERLMQALLSHDRVICEVFDQTTVLPLRFGISFTSVESLINYLESHAEEYVQKLDNLKNKTEYLLKFIPLSPPEPKLPHEGGGRQYFLAKKQHYKQLQDFQFMQAEEQQKIVDVISDSYRINIINSSHTQEVKIYILADKEDSVLLLNNFHVWQRACPHWNLFFSQNPLPPYHFV